MRKTVAAPNAVKVGRVAFSKFGKVGAAAAAAAAGIGLDQFDNGGRDRLFDNFWRTFLDAVDRLD